MAKEEKVIKWEHEKGDIYLEATQNRCIKGGEIAFSNSSGHHHRKTGEELSDCGVETPGL